jgi:Putative transposase of IS4/5 family (DUF4096)
MRLHDLTDAQWTTIEPFIPKQQPDPGRKRNDARRTPNGILFALKTGCTWERIWQALLSQLDTQGKLEWARAFLDGSVVPAKTGNLASTKRRMVVADGQGLPIGVYVASAQPHESQLAEATLATVRVPQKRGRPRTRRKHWSQTELTTAVTSPGDCVDGASSRPSRPLSAASAGKSNAALPGWTTVAGWSCATTALWIIIAPFV